MDLTVRDWLIIIGCLLALAVLLDGYRRMRNDRRDAIRLSSRKKNRDEPNDELTNPELPGGSARVVAVRETPSLHMKRGESKPAAAKRRPEPRSESSQTPRVEPQFNDDIQPDDDADYDKTQILDDAAKWATRPVADDDILFRDPEDEYGHGDESDSDYEESEYAELEPELGTELEMDSESDVEPGYEDFDSSDDDEPVLTEGLRANREERAVDTPASLQRERDEEKRPAAKANADAESEYRELLVLNVVAASGETFKGADLLQILLACDVRYGKMNIFHRYERSDGTGAVQFSIANLVEPGSFELDGIEDFTTPGVVFFLNLPGPEKSLKAFDAMVETANCLVKNLGGEMRDQSHSVATKQTLEHYRQRIRDFERRQLTLM